MNSFMDTLRQLGPMRLGLLGAVAVGLLGFFFFFSMRLSQPPMALLYSELSPTDAGQITARLDQQQIPFELRNGGATIMVPDDRVLRLRLSFAEAGIPRGGSIGYEIFDKGDVLGQTNFMQQINQTRALEGELARTVSALQPVAGARVHLVIPRRDLFNREKQEPTASVVLRMRDANNRLPRQQVQAIQSLIAAAVPGMRPVRVSVVDDRGNLLAKGQPESEDPSATNGSSEELKRAYEQRFARTIEGIIERTIGPGKVRAEVAVDLDFDRIVTNQESFDPDGRVVRSTQTVTETNESAENAAQVSVQNNLPDANQDSGGAKTTNRGNRQEETTNYEITKTVRQHIRESGIIRKLSVAVVVDGTTTGAGAEKKYEPRSPEEMQRITALVRSAIGFDEKRGDKLDVVNMQFYAPEEIQVDTKEPGLFDFTRADLLRLAEVFVMAIVALLVILLVARPIINHVLRSAQDRREQERMAAEQAAQQAQLMPGAAPAGLALPGGPAPGMEGPSEIEQMIDIAQVEGRVRASSIKKIGEIVEKHPEEAVAILRTWMYQET
ncbi:MAG: flagellar M-ring protein FliF [Alphaproteobacteria bacterium]|nr:flagellar M-ring protein FliF [Alphaproteobacteria bacterium]